MLGTTLKLGFDGSAVSRGMSGITGVMGRVSRQIGIGMARNVGARMTDTLGRVLMAVPDAIKDTTSWASSLEDISTQTRMTIPDLILLEEKLRLSGVAADEAATMISDMNKGIYEARTEAGGPARQALHDLGFFADEFNGKNPNEIFEMIGKRVAELGPEFEGLEKAMEPIFGGDVGYKLLRFFNDFEANSAQAESNIKGLAEAMGGDLAYKLDKFADSMGRFETFKRSLATIALDEIFRLPGGANAGNTLFDSIDPEKFRPAIEKIGNMLGRNLETVLTDGFEIGDIFKNIGRQIGAGIKESFDFSPTGIVKGMFGGNSNLNNRKSDPELKKQTTLLERIRDKTGIAIAQ